MKDCALCTLQPDCEESTVFLFATTPILRDLVHQHLTDVKANFCLQKDLFAIYSSHDQVIRELSRRLAEAERADIRITRNRGAASMAATPLDQWDRNIDTSWFDRAIREDAFTTFFQPIMDTSNQRVFAHECLIRLFLDKPYNGGEIMEAAMSRGRIHLFDSYARQLSIRSAAAQHTPGEKVFINFMPSSIYDPVHCMRSTIEQMRNTTLTPADIVFEVVESEKVRDVKHLRRICDYYRKEGFGFALDDVGTGSNSFQMICDLTPDFIKLDKSLISNVAQPMYYSAIGKLCEFAAQYSLKVIAEGIEEQDTMQELQKLGIQLMQGYYFGKPAAEMSNSAPSLMSLGEKLTRLSPNQTPAAKLA